MRQDRRIARLGRRLGMLGLLALVAAPSVAVDGPPALDPAVEARVEQILKQMTLDEKLDMLSGTGFDSKPLARLGIPAMAMTDGPVGVRTGQSTAFPAGVALAASWNPELVEEVGRAIAREARAHGKNVLLGPCVNIHRVPQGGRNFESYGEDPFLAARIAVAYIKGVQSQHVVATVKHFACNNQETERLTIDAKVDERTLEEIYLPAFKAAIQEAGAWSVMGAYNRVNGEYACANRTLLTDILKNAWGFPGFVMSDWGAVHGVAPYLNAGLDLEMPGGQFFTRDKLSLAFARREINAATVDEKVRRMLRAMLATGLFDAQQDPGALDTPEHRALNRRAAAAGIVLLKNEFDFLPLPGFETHPAPKPTPPAGEKGRPERGPGMAGGPTRRMPVKSIALIGPNVAVARTGGGGSALVNPTYAVSLVDALKARLGSRVALGYSPGVLVESDIKVAPDDVFSPPAGHEGTQGLWAEYFANTKLEGEPVARRLESNVGVDLDKLPAALGRTQFSVRWTGTLRVRTNGKHTLTAISDDGSRVYLDDRLLIDNSGVHAASAKYATLDLKAGQAHALRVEYVQQDGAATMTLGLNFMPKDPIKAAAEMASRAEVAIVCVGMTAALETEGTDRSDLKLPAGQDELVAAVVAANPRTIVIVNSGAAVTFGDWVARVPTLIQAWYPGQEGGNALADVLFGDVNPSGKLPTTFLRRWEDAPAYGNYPGQDGVVNYAEGIFVGYRHFEAKNLDTLFPFGHGLSYTSFAYRDVRVSPKAIARGQTVEVSFVLRNTGMREGTEVVQLYVGDREARLPRPTKELKAFQRVTLKPNEEQTVRFTVDESALRFYDPAVHAWVVEPGVFDLYVGSSSKDIWLRGAFTLE